MYYNLYYKPSIDRRKIDGFDQSPHPVKYQYISLREANQNFSRLIAAVERGEAFCITRRGREVARLTPSPASALADKSPDGNTSATFNTLAASATTGASLDERVLQLEARLDKLASTLPATDTK
jgi:prevent-host-death family protein